MSKKEIIINGEFPSPLFRAYKNKHYAYKFINQGHMILQSLKYYTEIEDNKRQDKGEGEGNVVVNMARPVYGLDKVTKEFSYLKHEDGPVYFKMSSVNPRYILCFSGPDVDLGYLSSHYGKHVVCINEPKKLVKDIVSYLKQLPDMPETIWLECTQVIYNRGLIVPKIPDPASHERLSLSYSQKSLEDSGDNEYRLLIALPISTSEPPKEIKIQLNKSLKYAEYIMNR